MAAGKYVYCIIGSGERRSFGDIGIENNGTVYTIPYKDIAAVVSDSPVKEYDLNEENVMSHMRIVTQVMEENTVVPMSFGMVFKDEEKLLAILEASYEVLKEALSRLDNKVELGVKVIIPKAAMQSAEDLFGGKSIGDFVKQCSWDFLQALNRVAVTSSEGRLFSDRLVLNAFFLVEKDKLDQFQKVLEEVDDRYKFLKTQYSGPWPPYNFCQIKLGRAGAEGQPTVKASL